MANMIVASSFLYLFRSTFASTFWQLRRSAKVLMPEHNSSFVNWIELRCCLPSSGQNDWNLIFGQKIRCCDSKLSKRPASMLYFWVAPYLGFWVTIEFKINMSVLSEVTPCFGFLATALGSNYSYNATKALLCGSSFCFGGQSNRF